MNRVSTLVSARQGLKGLLDDDPVFEVKADPLRLGAELWAAGDREAALAAFELAARDFAENFSLWHTIAALRLELGRPKSSLEACNEALRLAPEDPDTLFNVAVALEALADRPAARHCYLRVLALDEAHLGALLNLVTLLLSEKALDEALHVSELALQHHSENADCWFNHGEVMTSLHRHDDALMAYEKAFLLQPECVKADISAAISEAAAGRLEYSSRRLSEIASRNPEAFACFHSPLETDRESAYPELEAGRIALIAAYQRFRTCDWSVRESFVKLFQRVVDGDGCRRMDNPDLPFLGIGLPLPGEYRLRAARQVAERIAADVRGFPLVRTQRKERSRLRVGYISGDFRQHATACLMSRLPELHDRKRFEVFVYSSGPDDNSEIRDELIAGADVFCDVAHFDGFSTAQRIAMDGIDILVDLSGYTLHAASAALALRPAPLQVSYLAYLQSMGASWIDYALLDHTVLTDSERPFWSEKIAFLPRTLYLCDDQQIKDDPVSRSDAGLPEKAFVFCCLNAPWKIDPETFSCWMEIMHRVPESLLWLYADIPESCEHLRNEACRAGIETGRLIFASRVSREQHLARFRLADVFLDTFLCNAHTTCIEALNAGVPVLTRPGETVVSRVAASLLLAHGVPEMTVNTRQKYVDAACRLAKDSLWLDRVRQRTRNRSGSGLFCTERRVREIETAYEMMWARLEAGLLPADFDVPPME